jgi:hypothetical protein
MDPVRFLAYNVLNVLYVLVCAIAFNNIRWLFPLFHGEALLWIILAIATIQCHLGNAPERVKNYTFWMWILTSPLVWWSYYSWWSPLVFPLVNVPIMLLHFAQTNTTSPTSAPKTDYRDANKSD